MSVMASVIVVLILTRGCGDTTLQPDRTEINYDSIERVIKSRIPLPDTVFVKGETVTRWLPSVTVYDTIVVNGTTQYIYNDAPIDTVAIISHYLTQAVTYVDTIRDSALQAVILDTVFRNKIVGRGFNYKILRPVTINTYKPDRFQLIASFQSGVGINYTNHFNGVYVGVDVGLKFKSGTFFGVGYMAGSSHFLTLRAGQVIRLRKRK